MVKMPEVSLLVWKNLYAAVSQFGKLKPWEIMDDSELFGIQDPVTGEMGYACVMGTLGEVLAEPCPCGSGKKCKKCCGR